MCWEFHWHSYLFTYCENVMYRSGFLLLTSSHSSRINWRNCIQMEIHKNFQPKGCTGNFYVRRNWYNSTASNLYSSVYGIWKKYNCDRISVITDLGWPWLIHYTRLLRYSHCTLFLYRVLQSRQSNKLCTNPCSKTCPRDLIMYIDRTSS